MTVKDTQQIFGADSNRGPKSFENNNGFETQHISLSHSSRLSVYILAC